MPIIHNLPPANDILTPLVNMVAIFNPVTGLYEFGTTEYEMQRLDPRSMFLLENMVMSANITDEQLSKAKGEYYQVFNSFSNIEFDLKYKKSPKQRSQHFPDSINVASLGREIAMSKEFYSSDSNDYLVVKPKGSVLQTTDMLNITTIVFTLNAVIHRVTNQKAVDRFKKDAGQ